MGRRKTICGGCIGFHPAMPALSVCYAGLLALRCINAVKSDALSRNLKRVAVDDARLAGDVG